MFRGRNASVVRKKGPMLPAMNDEASSLALRVMAALSRLLSPGARVMVACSGGPDSQALLHLIAGAQHTLRINAVHAVGIDHGLRPHAAAELALAKTLAAALAVPFFGYHVDVERGGNCLSAARRARYAALRAHQRGHSMDVIAVGHSATDQLETILFKMARGSPAALCGMRQRRGSIIRPILLESRRDLQVYAHKMQLAYAIDPSNVDERRARPRLRHQVLPHLRILNPRLEKTGTALWTAAQQDEDLLQAMARRLLQRATGGRSDKPAGAHAVGSALAPPVALPTLYAAPAALARRAMRLWLGRAGLVHVAESWLSQLLGGALAAGMLQLGTVRLWRDKDILWQVPDQRHAWAQRPLRPPQSLFFAALRLQLQVAVTAVGATNVAQMYRGQCESVAFAADRLHFEVSVRPWRPGDKVRPFGLDGHIKVGDLFTNAKIPRALRQVWLVVTHGDHIIWVVGLKRGAGATVCQHTRRIWTMTVDDKTSHPQTSLPR